MDRDVEGQIEAHVEAQAAAGDHPFEHALPVPYIKPAVLAACVRQVYQVTGVVRVERTVGDVFDKVGKLEVHLFFVDQGQRVAFAAHFNDENSLDCAAFNLETKR
ncbi:hypothetical protein D3C72_1536070 [compost metagenome]